MIGGSVAFGCLSGGQGRLGFGALLHSHILLESCLHPLVEEHIVLIAAVEIDIKWYRRQHPDVDILIGQEGEDAASHTKKCSPIGEHRQPAYVGANVVGVSVVEGFECLAIGAVHAHGKHCAISEQPHCQCCKTHILCYAAGNPPYYHKRQCRKHEPHGEMQHYASASDVAIVEQRYERRTE